MSTQSRDRITGLILLAVSAFWCWGTLTTIPDTFSGPVGARGFPLGLGLLLGGLAVIILAGTVFPSPAKPDEEKKDHIPLGAELWAVGLTLLVLGGYAVAMWAVGFLIATALVVAAGLVAIGERRAPIVLGMALGMSLGVYLVFGKLLGVYLPYGAYVNLAF